MLMYEGIFGQHYRVNKHGVVCVRLKGEHNWRHSNYTLKQFKDAASRGCVKQVELPEV